jgi:DoxX-like family
MEVLSASAPWIGRLLSGVVIVFLLVDTLGKLIKVGPVIEGTLKLGYPESAIVPLGVLLLVGVVLYAIPRTSVLGAIYLTGFLGGAVATHFRIGSPLFTHVLFAVYVAVFVWGGLALRNPRLLSLLTDAR